MKINFLKVRQIAEFLSYIALIGGIWSGFIDLHYHAKEMEANAGKERLEAAERVYQTVDQRFNEFLTLCLEHPRLDCYSVSHNDRLTDDQKIQQKIIYADLTDVFEVAYVEYVKKKQEPNSEIQQLYKEQWSGWDTYIRKFIYRPAFIETWHEIGDEYDADFAKYMNCAATSKQGNCLPDDKTSAR